MRRTVLLLGALLLVWARGQAQETYEIKLKTSAVGDVVQVRTASTSNVRNVGSVRGEVLVDKTLRDSYEYVYRQTILEVMGGAKQVFRLRRQYETAQEVRDGMKTVLPYQGKTVLIENKEGKYRFTIERGKEITGADAEALDFEFNEQVERLDHRLLLPGKPVRVGESWELDPNAVLKAIPADKQLAVDAKAAKGTAKLVKVYQKDGRQFGVLALRLTLPIKEIVVGKAPVMADAGSQLTYDIEIDKCIDGSADASQTKGTMEITAKVKFVEDETRFMIVLEGKQSFEEKRESPKE